MKDDFSVGDTGGSIEKTRLLPILVPRTSWGPENEDKGALGTQDLKS